MGLGVRGGDGERLRGVEGQNCCKRKEKREEAGGRQGSGGEAGKGKG